MFSDKKVPFSYFRFKALKIWNPILHYVFFNCSTFYIFLSSIKLLRFIQFARACVCVCICNSFFWVAPLLSLFSFYLMTTFMLSHFVLANNLPVNIKHFSCICIKFFLSFLMELPGCMLMSKLVYSLYFYEHSYVCVCVPPVFGDMKLDGFQELTVQLAKPKL